MAINNDNHDSKAKEVTPNSDNRGSKAVQVTFEEIITSKPFKFTIGPDGEREFTMHSAVVAAQSAPLDRLVNGQMKEARDGHAVWKDVSPSTFVLFSQFAYTGDYSSVEPVEEPDAPVDVEGDEPEPAVPSPELALISIENVYRAHRPPQGRKPKKLSKLKLTEYNIERGTSFDKHKRLCLRLATITNSLDDCTAPQRLFWAPLSGPYEDFTEVFLSHARLYVFADYHQITKLGNLAYARLGLTLSGFMLVNERRRKDILSLVQFCFADDALVPDKLKGLVALYVGSRLEMFWQDDEFQEFYKEHGELSLALTTLILQ